MNPFEKAIDQAATETLEPQIITTELAVVEELKKQDIVGSKAAMIQSAFDPMVAMLKALESDYNEIISLDITKPATAKKAKELRLKMVKVRTGSAAIHKEQKAEYLRAGRAIDGVNNILKWAVEDKEENLAKIENYADNIEKEARKKVFEERLALLSQVISEAEAKLIPLGDLAPETFENMLNGYKFAQAEKERVAKEQAEKERLAKAEKEAEDLRIREENFKLKEQNDRVIRLTSIGFRYHETSTSFHHEGLKWGILKDKVQKMTPNEFDDLYRKKAKEIIDYNQRIHDEELAERSRIERERIKQDEKLKKERAERKRLEDEARQKAEQEENDRKAILAAQRKQKRAPDKIKLLALAEQISLLECTPLKDDDAKAILNNAIGMLAKVANYIKTNAEKL